MQALAAEERHNRAEADTLFRQSLALYQVVENKIGMAYALTGLTGLAEPPTKQAQLLGAAAAVLATTRLPFDPIERSHYEQLIATVRGQLDEATFAAAWVQGQAMLLAEAVAWVELNGPSLSKS